MMMNADVNITTYEYDFIIIGAGLYGAVMARELTDAGMKVLVVEKRDHIGGNCYTEEEDGVVVHKCGPHIFHTNNEKVWRYVNRFADFNEFKNKPLAVYKGECYTLPIDMRTFEALWGVTESDEAKEIIRDQVEAAGLAGKDPENLEEQAISMFGTDIYEKLIKGYTEKQWGRSCSELPASIVKRLNVTFGYADSYYEDKYQGVPASGYTTMIERMLDGIKVILNNNYKPLHKKLEERHDDHRSDYSAVCVPGSFERTPNCKYARLIYTGSIDEYYDYRFGRLGYRSVRFEEERIQGRTLYQDRAVVNYTDAETPFTRMTEHKQFDTGSPAFDRDYTIITREYPQECENADHSVRVDPLDSPAEYGLMRQDESNTTQEPMYPVRSDEDLKLYERYRKLAEEDEGVFFGGRLGTYRYMDMDDTIASALSDVKKLLNNNELL